MVDARNNLNRIVAMVVGWILVAVGVLGFIPGVVTAEGALFGLFGVNALHNVTHLVTGGILLWAAYAQAGAFARPINLTLGVIYAVIALLGFARILVHDMFNMTVDAFPHAGNLLHTILAVVFLGAAFASRETTTRRTAGAIR